MTPKEIAEKYKDQPNMKIFELPFEEQRVAMERLEEYAIFKFVDYGTPEENKKRRKEYEVRYLT